MFHATQQNLGTKILRSMTYSRIRCLNQTLKSTSTRTQDFHEFS